MKMKMKMMKRERRTPLMYQRPKTKKKRRKTRRPWRGQWATKKKEERHCSEEMKDLVLEEIGGKQGTRNHQELKDMLW